MRKIKKGLEFLFTKSLQRVYTVSMVKIKDPSDRDLSLVTAGFFGAVAGAISAIVITALVDKKTRSDMGEAILKLREQVTQTVKDLTKISRS